MLEKNGQQSPRQEFGKEHWVKIMKTSGMQDADLRRWHEAFERHAPQAHHDFYAGSALMNGKQLKLEI